MNMSDCEKAPIIGYVEQTPEQIEMINIFKSREIDLITFVNDFLNNPDYKDFPCDRRWLSIAKTHFQEGFMAAVRAVARPKGD
jgi:hypothetical protein